MQSGYSFGLPGILSRRPRMERAVAIMNCRLWRMAAADVRQVLAAHPQSTLVAARMVSDKVQDLLGGVRENRARAQPGNIHVVMFDQDAFDPVVAERLVARFQAEARGETLLVHSMTRPSWPAAAANRPREPERAERRLMFESDQGDRFFSLHLPGVEALHNEGESIEDLENLSYWLNTEAKKYNAVLFLTYPGHVQFRSMMLGVARRSVVFVRGRVPDFVKAGRARRDRIYLLDNQDAGDIARNYEALKGVCREVLAPTTFKTAPDALDRSCGQVARYLVGRTIGLALGGGGARAMAHVGVLEILDRLGLEWDAVSGTSMGAAVAAAVGQGLTSGAIRRLFERTLRRRPLSDWNVLPWRSFAAGRRFRRMLQTFFGNALTYEMALPCLPIACDVATGAAVVEQGCPVWQACLASGAAPGLFPPVIHDGRTLVDGGLIDNVPAEALDAFGIDFIIAVDISVNPADSPVNIRLTFRNIMRGIDIMGYHSVTRHLAFTDVNVAPDISEFSQFDWSRGIEIMERGREAMERKVPELRDELKKLQAGRIVRPAERGSVRR